ncbi:MAG: S9 family peptidase, partial [Synergistaceae bacterium]|nr:S9 family peptidase [Synergistaceae bacterium]
MHKTSLLLIFFIAIISFWGFSRIAFAALPPLIPIEDFFRNSEIARFSISPDGSKLAYMKPVDRRMNVFVRNIETGEERRLTTEKERDVAGFFWKGNDRIIFMKDSGGDENYHIWIVNIFGEEPRNLTPFPNVKSSI